MAKANRIVFASANAGKAREIEALLGDEFEVILQGELGIESAAETGTTFEANSLLKAQHAAAASGLPALADDSGIEVDALNGAPGVYSSRYAGEGASDADNLHKLLKEMQAVPDEQRTARFRCVLTFLRSATDAKPLVADGRWEGRMSDICATGTRTEKRPPPPRQGTGKITASDCSEWLRPDSGSGNNL